MKIFKEAILLSLLAVGLGACSEDNPWFGKHGKGGIDLKLSTSVEVTDAIPVVRSGAPELEAPDAADFAIELRDIDTDQARTWESLDHFHSEEGFDVGNYTLTAFYGNENECGFDKPCFKGVADVSVLEGRESSISVTAQLANAMLSVEYTDAFKNYFRDYSVTAHTDGHANVVFGKSETRAGFLTPGDVTLQVSFTNPSGKKATITPAEFPAQARHHYHVKFDVDSEPMGDAVLSVVFDDSVNKENVTISLSDELYNADAPIVHAEGFTSGQTFEALAGNAAPTPIKFESICKGGIEKAVLKIAQISGRETYSPPFDTELDLVKADESTQYQLEQNGIKVVGLFRNPEQMAVVDVTGLSSHLPEGTFEITLTVTDKVGRNNDTPVVLNLSTLPISLSVTGGSAVYDYPGNAVSVKPTVDATVMVSYNGLNPEKSISFKNMCRTGIYKDCEIVDVKESTATRGFENKVYIFNIKVCDVENSPLPMQVWFNGNHHGDFTIDIIEPEYSLVADVFAKYARFKVVTANEADIPTIVNGLTLYKDGQPVDKSLLTTNPEKGLLTLDDLTPDTDYAIGHSLTKRPNGLPDSKVLNIHTEAEAQIPNSNFAQKQRTIDWDPINSGGQYQYLGTKYINHSSIEVDTPTGWATLNPITCYTGAAEKNTWFCVPSTISNSDNSVLIRTVAYDHNGQMPDNDNHGVGVHNKHSRNVPKSFASKSSGELFLGTYTFNGTAKRTDGISFSSRPTSLTFTYSYEPVANEVGQVYIGIVGENGSIISEFRTDLSAATNNQTTLALPAYPFGIKPAGIRLSFKSSKNVISVPVPTDLDDVTTTLATSGGKSIPANQYKTLCVGSKLTISNVKLNY